MINLFKKARTKLGINGSVITADATEDAPATFFSDRNYKISRVNSDTYLQELMDICIGERISLIVPTIDTELLPLALNREIIESKTDAKILLSSTDLIKNCRNKYDTAEWLQTLGFLTPKIYAYDPSSEYSFPLFIKPFDGSSSINTFKINNREELNFFVKYIPNYIIQEYIEGIEYTIDVLADLQGNPLYIVPRKRLATRSGEISKGRISKDPEIIRLIGELVEKTRPIGPITVQGIMSKGRFYIIEINPRFGGGVPMSITAGAKIPEKIYKILNGTPVFYEDDYEDDLLIVRFDASISINKEGRAADV